MEGVRLVYRPHPGTGRTDPSVGRLRVEVNGEIVPRGRHADHQLADGDKVEIVQIVEPARSLAAHEELTGHAEAVLPPPTQS